jgi:hypothetical protein
MRIVLLGLLALLVTHDAASAAQRRLAPAPVRHCDDRPVTFSFGKLLFGGRPEWNGCTPPVYEYGYFIGQDPDPFIRQQLRREPWTGAYELMK